MNLENLSTLEVKLQHNIKVKLKWKEKKTI